MVDDILDLRSDQPKHDRHGDLTTLGASCVDIHPLAPVIGHDGNGFLVPDADIPEAVANATGPFVPLFERKGLIFVLPAQALWVMIGVHL